MIFALIGCVHSVDVTLMGATVGPSTATLEAWDGMGKVPSETRDRAISAANAVDPMVGLSVATLATWLDGIAPPDPRGSLATVDGTLTVSLEARSDTFTPTWTAKLAAVPLGKETLLRLRLEDEDLDAPDPIATFDLDAAALRRALATGKPYTIDVSRNTAGQLLTVTLRVEKSTAGN